jgi:hypothetical protein
VRDVAAEARARPGLNGHEKPRAAQQQQRDRRASAFVGVADADVASDGDAISAARFTGRLLTAKRARPRGLAALSAS